MKRVSQMISITLVSVSFLLMAASTGPVHTWDWANVKVQNPQLPGEVVETETGVKALRVEAADSDADPNTNLKTVPLLQIQDPDLSDLRWYVAGQIRYEGVVGAAYLEVWHYFSDGDAYFSRTLAPQGPLQSIQGSSDWRPFGIPFDATQTHEIPTLMEFNLVFPGEEGVVDIGPVELWNGVPQKLPILPAWWGSTGGGVAGAILGTTLGMMGAVIGSLAGSGRGRRVALVLTRFTIGVSGLVLISGIYAVLVGQAYAVYYPLILAGGLGVGIFGGTYRTILKRYQEIELRKMQAQDLL